MRADSLSQIHTAAFTDTRAWSADEIAALLDSPHVFAVDVPAGFAMGRVVVDEAELLTIAVLPNARGQGVGRQLLHAFETHARNKGAMRAFLDVAADNHPALQLYTSAGWGESGRRRGYYAHKDGTKVDAVLMDKPLT